MGEPDASGSPFFEVNSMPKTRIHEDAMLDSLRRDPQFAAAYLTEVFADGDQAEMMLALRRVAQAHGGVAAVAQAARLKRTRCTAHFRPRAILNCAACMRCYRRWGCAWPSSRHNRSTRAREKGDSPRSRPFLFTSRVPPRLTPESHRSAWRFSGFDCQRAGSHTSCRKRSLLASGW